MAKYHINPETGEPGKCSAQKQCPFGDATNDHYASVDEARDAAEDFYDQFEHGVEATAESSPGEQKMYNAWLMEVEYNDWNYAQAGKVARWMLVRGGEDFTVAASDEMSTTLELNPGVFLYEDAQEKGLPSPEDCPKIEVVIGTKRNRVDYALYIDDKEIYVSDIDDIDNGEEMRRFISGITSYVYDDLAMGEYDDKLKGKS